MYEVTWVRKLYGDHSDTLNREDHMYVIHKFQISSRAQNSLTIYNDLSEH